MALGRWGPAILVASHMRSNLHVEVTVFCDPTAYFVGWVFCTKLRGLTSQNTSVKSSSAYLTPWSRVLLEKLVVTAASQEIPHFLWYPNASDRVQKSTPSVSIQSQINPFNAPNRFLEDPL